MKPNDIFMNPETDEIMVVVKLMVSQIGNLLAEVDTLNGIRLTDVKFLRNCKKIGVSNEFRNGDILYDKVNEDIVIFDEYVSWRKINGLEVCQIELPEVKTMTQVAWIEQECIKLGNIHD